MTETLAKFKTTSLSDLDKVTLLNRSDKKYLFNRSYLLPFLKDLSKNYYLLKINDVLSHPYESVYFDTNDFSLFYSHIRGKSNRYKFRNRKYITTGDSFNEIKFKNNKGRTSKKRLSRSSFKNFLDNKFSNLIEENTPIEPTLLQPSVIINFKRLTFTDYSFTERLTIDLNLNFSSVDTNLRKNYENLIILEVKQDRMSNKSVIDRILLKHRIFKSSSSKYCLGIYSIFRNIKYNRFKPKFRQITKILNKNGDIYA